MFVIASNKSEDAQLSWIFNLTITLIQDLMVNPLLGVGIQIILLRLKKSIEKKNPNFLRNNIIRSTRNDCELIYVIYFIIINA